MEANCNESTGKLCTIVFNAKIVLQHFSGVQASGRLTAQIMSQNLQNGRKRFRHSCVQYMQHTRGNWFDADKLASFFEYMTSEM